MDDRIVMLDDGNVAGEITWAQAEDILIVDHTYVDPKYRGGAYAQALVEKLVEKAREDDLKILPLCPFTRKTIETHPEYQDVLRK
jgi:predicted GNAT family acetyltransferase